MENLKKQLYEQSAMRNSMDTPRGYIYILCFNGYFIVTGQYK